MPARSKTCYSTSSCGSDADWGPYGAEGVGVVMDAVLYSWITRNSLLANLREEFLG